MIQVESINKSLPSARVFHLYFRRFYFPVKLVTARSVVCGVLWSIPARPDAMQGRIHRELLVNFQPYSNSSTEMKQ